MSAKRRKSRHDSGDISCALSANGCDVAVDTQGSNDNAPALITVHVV